MTTEKLRLIGRETNNTKETENGKTERKEGVLVRKKESDRAVGCICCLSAQGERNVSFCAEPVSDGCHYPTQWV